MTTLNFNAIETADKCGNNVSLYDLLIRKNKSEIYRSVFISRTGDVYIEAYNESYLKATRNARLYGQTKQRILDILIFKILPQLHDLKFFTRSNGDNFHQISFLSTPLDNSQHLVISFESIQAGNR